MAEQHLIEAGVESSENVPFRIEQRGIDHVPENERSMRPRQLSGLWAGSLFNVEYLVFGALVVAAFGLSLPQAIIVIVAGNLSFILTGFGSIQGARAGTAASVVTRAPFARRGAQLMAAFNWIIMVGFEITGLGLIVTAGEGLAAKAGFTPGTPMKVAFIIVAVGLQAILPVLGHATMVKFIKYLVVPCVAIFAIVAGYTLPKVHFTTAHGASWQLCFVALALVFSAAGFSWPTGSDYARYLPRETPAKRIIGSVFLGAGGSSVLVMLLGAALATVASSSSTLIGGAATVLPNWIGVIYLAFGILQLLAINTLDLYSSGLSLQATGLPVTRYKAVLVDTGLCLIFLSVLVFSSSFATALSDFLLFILIFLSPFFGIYLVDWVLRKGGYDLEDLFRERGGKYWGVNGWSVPALVSLGLGMGCSTLFLNASPAFVGPLSNDLGGADFSAFAGLFVGGGVYLAWSATRARTRKSRGEAASSRVLTGTAPAMSAAEARAPQ